MVKRTAKEVRKDILGVLKDGSSYSYGAIERKANTNWQTVRNHCDELEMFSSVRISKDKKIKITKKGIDLYEKMKRK